MTTGNEQYALYLFRRGFDTFDIAQALKLAEPQVVRMLEAARFDERQQQPRKAVSQ